MTVNGSYEITETNIHEIQKLTKDTNPLHHGDNPIALGFQIISAAHGLLDFGEFLRYDARFTHPARPGESLQAENTNQGTYVTFNAETKQAYMYGSFTRQGSPLEQSMTTSQGHNFHLTEEDFLRYFQLTGSQSKQLFTAAYISAALLEEAENQGLGLSGEKKPVYVRQQLSFRPEEEITLDTTLRIEVPQFNLSTTRGILRTKVSGYVEDQLVYSGKLMLKLIERL